MILTVLLALAVIAALAGAYKRDIASIALLASFALSTVLCWSGVPFNAAVWMVIDTAVVMAIVRPGMKRRDWLIVVSFPPVWAVYFIEPRWGSTAVDLIVAGQMFLTFPAEWVRWFWRRSQWINRGWNPFDKFDLRGMAGATA